MNWTTNRQLATLVRDRLRQFLLRRVGLKNEFSIFRADLNFGAGLDVAAQNLFRQRIFQEALDRASHGPGAVIWIVTFFDHQLVRQVVENDLHFFRFEATFPFFLLKLDNLESMRSLSPA